METQHDDKRTAQYKENSLSLIGAVSMRALGNSRLHAVALR